MQQRFLLFQRLCDRVYSIRDQIIAEFGFDQFALKEVRIQHQNDELPEEPQIAKKLLRDPELEPVLGQYVLLIMAQKPGKHGQWYLKFGVNKQLESQQIIDDREGKTVTMTSHEKTRWDVIEAEHERQRAVLDARLTTPPKTGPPEVLKVSTIENPLLPPDQSWLPADLKIGLWESGWLLAHGVTSEFVKARFDPQVSDESSIVEDLSRMIRNHNKCHELLETFHHGAELVRSL